MNKLVIGLFMLPIAVFADSSNFGRLFTTEDERNFLDEMRVTGEIHIVGDVGVSARVDSVVFNGVYIPKRGKPIYWFNEGRKKPKEIVVTNVNERGMVSLADQSKRRIDGLKPGQAYEFKAKIVREYFDRLDIFDQMAKKNRRPALLSKSDDQKQDVNELSKDALIDALRQTVDGES